MAIIDRKNNIKQAGRHKDVLHLKLLREYRTHALQFLAILFLCFIGTWIFSGFDTMWRAVDRTFETYFRDYNLFDIQLTDTSFGHDAINKAENAAGVVKVRPRTVVEVKRYGTDDLVYIALCLFDGPMDLNTPRILEGEALHTRDSKGCLVEKSFADAQGLKVGDVLFVELNGIHTRLIVRGVIQSPEFPRIARHTVQDSAHYGFVYANKAVFPQLPFNNLLIKIGNGVDITGTEIALHFALPGANILDQKSYDPVVSCRYFSTIFRTLTFLFPLIALIVAAVIVFSTLKRLIGDERMNIGLMRSLGYTDGRIFGHYVWYPIVPSVIGALAGLIIGRMTIPQIIWKVISGVISTPQFIMVPPSAVSLIVVVSYVLLSVLICLYAFRKTAEESEAALLKPKPPKSGKRILLERAAFLWKRLSVSGKIVLRNLSRDKARVFISILAVFACNMLIICAFCLNDSILTTIGSKYGEMLSYDYRVELFPDKSFSVRTYKQMLNAQRVEGVMEKKLEASSWTNTKNCLVTVLERGQTSVRLGPDGTAVSLPLDGIVISRKLAEAFGVGVGDDFFIRSEDHRLEAQTTVRMITETSVGHGVFMSRDVWYDLHIGDFKLNALFVTGITPHSLDHLARLKECDKITSLKEEYKELTQKLSPATVAFIIMSFVALGLTFVICFDMSRLRFIEHRREYATMRVMGYHHGEIIRQIMGAALFIGLTGVLLGILPGIHLTKTILALCEQEYLVFVPCTSADSIIIASLISFLYSLLIELIYALRVKYIDMVEALKSLE